MVLPIGSPPRIQTYKHNELHERKRYTLPNGTSLFTPLDRQIDATFGLPPVHEYFRQRSGGQDHGVGGQEGGTTPTQAPTSAEDDGDDETFEKAFSLVRAGATTIPATVADNNNCTTIPSVMEGFPGSLTPWPYQMSAAGKVSEMLLQHNCALLALSMGLGKTLIIILVLACFGAFTSQRKGPILIVVPLALIPQWKEQLETLVQPSPRVCVYHEKKMAGARNTTDYTHSELVTFDVVLTTYGMLREEFDKMNSATSACLGWFLLRLPFGLPRRLAYPLFAIFWWFIVLDEGHLISNPKTKTSIAACTLKGQYRVTLTGTPLQNDYLDVGGLFRFLRVDPWAKVETFKKYFYKGRKNKRDALLHRQVTAVLALTVRAVSLRLRITDSFEGEPVANFPEPQELPVYHDMTSAQTVYQDATKHIWDPQTRKEVEEKRKSRKKTGYVPPLGKNETFPAIMKARLSLIHDLCPFAGYGEANDGQHDLLEGPGVDTRELEDRILAISNNDSNAEGGGNRDRWKKSIAKRNKFRKEIKKTCLQSPRITELLSHIQALPGKDSKWKALIFSEFLCGLDVVEEALLKKGYKVLRYDGWLTEKQKQEALDDFNDPEKGYDFLLITNRSGGLGLNIQIAKAVFHLTPCWNPALTAQCTGRAVRPGQESVVQVRHFLVDQSIEQHIWSLAKMKKVKASQVLDPPEHILHEMNNIAKSSLTSFDDLMAQSAMKAAEYQAWLERRKVKHAAAVLARRSAQEERTQRTAIAFIERLGLGNHNIDWQAAMEMGRAELENDDGDGYDSDEFSDLDIVDVDDPNDLDYVPGEIEGYDDDL